MWGDVLCRGSGGRSPPEAEAILDFYMHNFDRILNYFCFSRATEIRLTLWIREKYRENVKIWGTLYIGVLPTPNSGGTCPPVPQGLHLCRRWPGRRTQQQQQQMPTWKCASSVSQLQLLTSVKACTFYARRCWSPTGVKQYRVYVRYAC